jgi:hypothetical protein
MATLAQQGDKVSKCPFQSNKRVNALFRATARLPVSAPTMTENRAQSIA